MPLSWNEIKDRALRFSWDWADESSEDAEAKSFLDAFFNVFGVPSKRVATFEQRNKRPRSLAAGSFIKTQGGLWVTFSHVATTNFTSQNPPNRHSHRKDKRRFSKIKASPSAAIT